MKIYDITIHLKKLEWQINSKKIKEIIRIKAEVNEKKTFTREFPGGLVVRIWCFHCHGPGLVCSLGTESPTSSYCT